MAAQLRTTPLVFIIFWSHRLQDGLGCKSLQAMALLGAMVWEEMGRLEGMNPTAPAVGLQSRGLMAVTIPT